MRGGSFDRDPSACPSSVWKPEPTREITQAEIDANLYTMRRDLVAGRYDADLPPGYLARLGSGDTFDVRGAGE